MIEELKQTEQKTYLEKMQLLPTPLPPQFVRLAEYEGGQRFLALWYQATQSCLADGRMMRGISFYRAYAPLADHISVSVYVKTLEADLGSDDAPPTHTLVLDTSESKIYIGEFNLAQRLLETQYPSNQQEIKAELKKAEKMMSKMKTANSLKDFQQYGMFEFFGASLSAADDTTNKLLLEMKDFLDQFVPPEIAELIKKYGNIF